MGRTNRLELIYNHFHGILEIEDAPANDNGEPHGIAPTIEQNVGVPLVGTHPQRHATIGNIVGAFTSITTTEYMRAVKELNWRPFNGKLWQRNYYEHIIRDGNDHDRIVNYIMDSPRNWNNVPYNT